MDHWIRRPYVAASTSFQRHAQRISGRHLDVAGAAPAADAEGHIYCITGNGKFDADMGEMDFGDSFLKLTPSGDGLVVADYFTPYNQALLDATDVDLGSGPPLLLPASAGSDAHPNLLIGC